MEEEKPKSNLARRNSLGGIKTVSFALEKVESKQSNSEKLLLSHSTSLLEVKNAVKNLEKSINKISSKIEMLESNFNDLLNG